MSNDQEPTPPNGPPNPSASTHDHGLPVVPDDAQVANLLSEAAEQAHRLVNEYGAPAKTDADTATPYDSDDNERFDPADPAAQIDHVETILDDVVAALSPNPSDTETTPPPHAAAFHPPADRAGVPNSDIIAQADEAQTVEPAFDSGAQPVENNNPPPNTLQDMPPQPLLCHFRSITGFMESAAARLAERVVCLLELVDRPFSWLGEGARFWAGRAALGILLATLALMIYTVFR